MSGFRPVYAAVALCAAFPFVVHAQSNRGRGLPDTRVLTVAADKVDALTTLMARTDVDAVALDAPRAALDARPAARQALLSWVGRGGVVYLHTDAAQLFGYRTIAARPGTARQAGQFFGRARAALPPGAHRLLWGNAGRAGRGPRSLEVGTVFYQLAPGDHLVSDHPGGVGLLEVTDLAAPPSARPLFAASLAGFGKGYALFTPNFVEQHRGDGAAFLANLSRFAVEAGLTARRRAAQQVSDDDLVAVPGGMLDKTNTTLAAWQQLLEGDRANATQVGDQVTIDAAPQAATAPQILLTRRDVRAIVLGFSGGEETVPPARALLATLRARLALQRENLSAAAQFLAQAAQLAPQAAETYFVQGALGAGRAKGTVQTAPDAAATWRNCAAAWGQSLRSVALADWLTAKNRDRVEPAASVCGVPREMVETWQGAAASAAAIAALEPPLATVGGSGGNPITLRYFGDDPTLRAMVQATALLGRGSDALGWRADREEVLLFPTTPYLANFRAAIGQWEQRAPIPAVWQGDVSGQRVLVWTESPTLTIGGGPSPINNVPIEGVTPDLQAPVRLARLHAFVLVDALAGGGTPPPSWMTFGLAGLANDGVTTQMTMSTRMGQATVDSLKSGGILSPEQFARANVSVSNMTQAEVAGSGLMAYFYTRHGAGKVVETLQRLGSGQSVDAALAATTGFGEAQLFAAYQAALNGR